MPFATLFASLPAGLTNVWNFLRSGGDVMFLIVGCSFASLTIVIIICK